MNQDRNITAKNDNLEITRPPPELLTEAQVIMPGDRISAYSGGLPQLLLRILPSLQFFPFCYCGILLSLIPLYNKHRRVVSVPILFSRGVSHFLHLSGHLLILSAASPI